MADDRKPRPEGAAPADPASGPDTPELAIPVETVAWIILKARAFDVKQPSDMQDEEDDGDNPLGVLEDRADDPTGAELRPGSRISTMTSRPSSSR